MTYFVATTEKILIKGLVVLFWDNVWKLHKFPKSVILDRELQFAAELTKKLNKILEVETRLSIVFYSWIDRQAEYINQELE